MTRWARLTWQAADPAAVSADLGRRLGLAPAREAATEGAFLLGLGPERLEVVPWRRESPADRPSASGRLVFEPIEGGADEPPPAGGPLILYGVGWATVELDRAEAELGAWLAGPADGGEDGPEPHLGGRARVRRSAGLPCATLVLSEPTTEGRLAASLARDGEGPCALYLRPADGLAAWLRGARARRVPVAPAAEGPFGRSVLVPPRAVAGPFVIVVEGAPDASRGAGPGTIRP